MTNRLEKTPFVFFFVFFFAGVILSLYTHFNWLFLFYHRRLGLGAFRKDHLELIRFCCCFLRLLFAIVCVFFISISN